MCYFFTKILDMLSFSSKQESKFAEQGFLILDRIIDSQTVSELKKSFTRLFNGEFETGITPDEVNWQFHNGDPTLTRQICNGWKADRTIAGVVLREDFGQMLAQLGGWPGTRIMIDNILWKPPRTRPLGYHQDSAYLKWFVPDDLLTLWIALDDTSRQGGTIEFVCGSHLWAHCDELEGEFHGPEDYCKPMLAAAQAVDIKPEIVHVEVNAGGGSIHHGWLWHGSGHNRGNTDRRSVVLHAMRSDAEFNPQFLQQGIGAIYSKYKHLDDNLLDENYFPILWRQDGYRTPGINHFLA